MIPCDIVNMAPTLFWLYFFGFDTFSPREGKKKKWKEVFEKNTERAIYLTMCFNYGSSIFWLCPLCVCVALCSVYVTYLPPDCQHRHYRFAWLIFAHLHCLVYLFFFHSFSFMLDARTHTQTFLLFSSPLLSLFFFSFLKRVCSAQDSVVVSPFLPSASNSASE